MVCHVVERLQRVVDEVVVVAAPDMPLPSGLASLGVRVARDPEEGLGPLAGLAEGLACVSAERVFVTGTDAPYLTSEFIRLVLAHEAAAPEIDGHVQTLAASYPSRAHELARRILRKGRRRPLDLLEAVGYRTLAAEEIPDPKPLLGFNTPAAYLDAARSEHADATATLELPDGATHVLPIGPLHDFLSFARRRAGLEGEINEDFWVSLQTPDVISDSDIPIGPGEHLLVRSHPMGWATEEPLR